MRMLPRPGADQDFSFVPAVTSLATKPVGLISEVLNNDSIDFHRGRKHTPGDYFIHVSDLIQFNSTRRFCPRQQAISLIDQRGDTNLRKIPPGMRLLHAIGHAVQSHITTEFIARSRDKDKVWGKWICNCGQTAKDHSFKPKAGEYTCSICKSDPINYAEITIIWNEYRLAGHPDLCIVWNGVLHIYEIKTIDRQGVNFETMDAPLGDHTLQGSMYYWIMRATRERELKTLKEYPGAFDPRIPFEIDPFVNYVYVDRSNKNLFKRIFYKEFTKRASSFARIEPLIHSAKVLRESLEKRILPARLDLCRNVNSPRAKNCNCAVPCFSRRKDTL